MTITVFAPAKINLYLHVTGKRDDGYHLLDSLVAFTDEIGDRITVEPADSFQLRITGSQSAALENLSSSDNLVSRAAQMLAMQVNRPLHCAITLEKDLPAASGIGGGSTDAAATLLALARFWQRAPESLPLETLARALGQDVVACLYRKSCYFRGIGDEVAFAPALPAAAILLVNPGVAVPTPAIFKARQGAFSSPAPLTTWPQDFAELVGQLQERRNDLSPPAMALAPVISECLTTLRSTPDCAFAAMSGSGATCFGLYADSAKAETAAASIAKKHPTWWLRTGRLPFIGVIS